MAEFKSLEVYKFPRDTSSTTTDTLYWKKLGFPVAFKEYGAIDNIDFCLHEPHNFAVSCSSKVQLYSPVDNSICATLSRFSNTVYGGVFRRDGKLLVAGGEDATLRLFEVQSNKLLRIFKGHKAATHRCNFTKDGVHIVSFSDDKSVALWDMPTQKKILRYEEHKDYIRAGAINEASENIFISGSYDHTIKMYDARTSACVMSVDHGVPVEAVLMLSSGGLFISAGGTSIKVWDPIAGRLLTQVSQHHKTITSLCLASNGQRLMSGALDRHIKIYDVSSYEVVHTLDYPSPILSVACSPEDKIVVAGMTDGLLSIKHRKAEPDPEIKTKKHRQNTFYQYRLYGTDFKPEEGDIVVPENKSNRLRNYDMHLKKFESSRALDAVLKEHVHRQQPELTVNVMMELIRRGALTSAMAGREGTSLLQLLKFVTKYIADQRFSRVLVDVGLKLIEIYGPKLSNPATKKMFQSLLDSVSNQVLYLKELNDIQGRIQTVLAVEQTRNAVEETALYTNNALHNKTKDISSRDIS